MTKVKTFKLLPLVMFSSIAVAQTSGVAEQQPIASNVAAQPVAVNPAQDPILPQLSFSAQQARAAELAKRADYLLEQEQIRQEQARKQAEAETKVRQTVGNSSLLFTSATAKAYL